VNVIGGPVDDESRSTHLANDAAEIGEEVGTEFGFDQRAALVGAEDDVQQDIAAGVRHFFRPFRGLAIYRIPTACAVGCNIAPLRGCQMSRFF